MYQIKLKARSNYLQINIGFKKKTNRHIKCRLVFMLFQLNSIYLVETNQRYQHQCMNRRRKYQEQKLQQFHLQ